MKLRIVIATVAVAFGSAAIAGPGCHTGHEKQVMSCADGTVWDSATQTCVTQVAS